MEELVLTDPIVVPEQTTNKYHVVAMTLDMEFPNPGAPPAPGEPGMIDIRLKDNLGGGLSHRYIGKEAVDLMKFLNTANLTVKSMHKRILEKLSNDGVIPGTVTGTPDPPTTTE